MKTIKISKGKSYPVGTVHTWADGKQYKKTPDGWIEAGGLERKAKVESPEAMEVLVRDIKSLHELSDKVRKTTFKVDGVITDEYREVASNYAEGAKKFLATHGSARMSTFTQYTTLKKRLQHVIGITNLSNKVKKKDGPFGT